MSLYAITTKSGTGVVHLVEGDMTDHRAWVDALLTRCGQRLVARNYFHSFEDYLSTYNPRGVLCSNCTFKEDSP